MKHGYLLAGTAAAVLLLSSCSPPVDPVQGWDEPSAYIVEEFFDEEKDAEPTPIPQVDKPSAEPEDDVHKEFRQEIEAFREKYVFDLWEFVDLSRKSDEKIDALREGYSEEAKVETVLDYFNMAGQEDAAEQFLGDHLLDSIYYVTGRQLDMSIELVPTTMGDDTFIDTQTGEVVDHLLLVHSLEENAWYDLNDLMERYPRYAQRSVAIHGLSTDPVLVVAKDLADTVHVAAHEFMHHVFFQLHADYPREGEYVNEHALVDFYGWIVAWDAIDRFYYDSFDAEQQQHIDDLRESFFDEEENPLPNKPVSMSTFKPISTGRGGYYLSGDPIIDLYNCIGDPEEALRVFAQLESEESLDDELQACIMKEFYDAPKPSSVPVK